MFSRKPVSTPNEVDDLVFHGKKKGLIKSFYIPSHCTIFLLHLDSITSYFVQQKCSKVKKDPNLYFKHILQFSNSFSGKLLKLQSGLHF